MNTGHLGFHYSPTTGTILVLNFAEVIQLTEEYYAPNLQVTLQVHPQLQNNHYSDWSSVNSQRKMVIVPMN